MPISSKILGAPGRDNALFLCIHDGQEETIFLFDCGQDCLSNLSKSEIRKIDHLMFSHLHMDHIAGFDTFFRFTYDRNNKPNVIWGPPGTSRIMHNRFRGFIWNLHHGLQASWIIRDIHPNEVSSARMELDEAFENLYDHGANQTEGAILGAPSFTVQAKLMDHGTPCVAYVIREKPREKVGSTRMLELGLTGGKWLGEVKGDTPDEKEIILANQKFTLGFLRKELLRMVRGNSIAYLTDFFPDGDAITGLAPLIKNCQTLVCESQYRNQDLELATRHFHFTALHAAELALRAEVEELVLFHVSDRYCERELQEMLKEARSIFPETRFPDTWIFNV